MFFLDKLPLHHYGVIKHFFGCRCVWSAIMGWSGQAVIKLACRWKLNPAGTNPKNNPVADACSGQPWDGNEENRNSSTENSDRLNTTRVLRGLPLRHLLKSTPSPPQARSKSATNVSVLVNTLITNNMHRHHGTFTFTAAPPFWVLAVWDFLASSGGCMWGRRVDAIVDQLVLGRYLADPGTLLDDVGG